jgi:two-component system alkaline phosphatase synthesis response regulator PhoP
MTKKILIVDDDEAILEAVRIAIESEGYNVKTLVDGDKIDQVVRSFKPDLILLDLLLSGRNGSEITQELKSYPDIKNIPVVIISAHPAAKTTAFAGGADDFLAKPFDLDDLFNIIEFHLKPKDIPNKIKKNTYFQAE